MGRLKHIEIVLDSEHNVYYPGEVVRGKCLLELRNELKIKTVKVCMIGAARVRLNQAHHSNGNLVVHAEHNNSEIEYFFDKQILFNSENGLSETLGKGVHNFKFEFELPSSGISTSFESKYGNIRYWIKVEVEKSWSPSYRIKKAFTLIHPININQEEYLIPSEKRVEKTMCCLLCRPANITINAKTDRIGYCPGESIAISAEFENHTARSITPCATLHQTQLFLCGGKLRSRDSKVTIFPGNAIEPHKIAVWNRQLLKIPAVSPSILNCRLIRVEYFVRIAVRIPLAGSKCYVDLSIVVGTTPYRTSRLSASSLSSVAHMGQHSCAQLPLSSSRSSIADPRLLNRGSQPNQSNSAFVDEFARPSPSITPPPTYVDCINGSVDINDEEDETMFGYSRFTPRYTYSVNRLIPPPPAYSEVNKLV